jgi:hypothetical protein
LNGVEADVAKPFMPQFELCLLIFCYNPKKEEMMVIQIKKKNLLITKCLPVSALSNNNTRTTVMFR